MIEGLVRDGTVALLALAVLGLEGLAILLVAKGQARLPLLANALSGVALILALRAALLDQAPHWVALWLGLSFAAHLLDVFSRLRR
jgi:hypothetical protein